jgi:perosamine synthetase
MSSLQAALGLAQLERIDELVERKREIFSWYKSELENCSGITLNFELPGTTNTYWMVSAILDEKLGIKKEKLKTILSEENIDSRPFFDPLSDIPAYSHLDEAKKARQRNKTGYSLAPFGINLPSGYSLTRADVKRVCEVLKAVMQTGFK